MISQSNTPSNSASRNRKWQRLAATATLLSTIALTPMSAWSLSLGGMRVMSSLGEPLRAQLSLGQLTEDELRSVSAGFAPSAVYQAAGITPSPLLNSVSINIDKSVSSNVVVNLVGSSPVSEPFVDLLLEIKWASGKVVRDYTLLINPAEQATAPLSTEQVIPAAPQVSNPNLALPIESGANSGIVAGNVINEVLAAPITENPTNQAEPAAPEPIEAKPEPAPRAATRSSERSSDADASANKRVRVARGDTAAALAQANLPEGVSLDQMLQAMVQANPSAFVDGNVNRLKSGVQLAIPSAEEAQAIDPGQARRLVRAQSKDFNAYRRSLASNAPTQSFDAAGQVASGQVETQVEDKAAAAPVADQLTLSKGSVSAGDQTEASIAAAKQAQDEQAQQADLTRNIDELKALADGTPGVVADGSATTTAETGAAPSVAAVPEAPAAPIPNVEVEEPKSAIDRLMSQPWTLPAFFALLALLIALVISRMNKRQKAASAHASAPQAAPSGSSNGMNFNLSDINLDLNPVGAASTSEAGNSEALFSKFELAKEFLSLGDRVAAKALAEEVQADATGLLKRRAELFLSELG